MDYSYEFIAIAGVTEKFQGRLDAPLEDDVSGGSRLIAGHLNIHEVSEGSEEKG